MKKFLTALLCLAALAGASTAHAYQVKRSTLVDRLDTCEAILQDLQSSTKTAIPTDILRRARGIVIVNQVQAGFIFGVKDGYGVVMIKKANGRWSLPVLVAAGELSFGLQFGANAIESVMVVTDDNTPRIMFNQRFNVGVDAKAVAGPHAAETERFNKELLNAPVLVYTKTRGLFAGATVKTGWLQRDDTTNFTLYNTSYTMPELLYSDWVQPIPEVAFLVNYVQKIAP